MGGNTVRREHGTIFLLRPRVAACLDAFDDLVACRRDAGSRMDSSLQWWEGVELFSLRCMELVSRCRSMYSFLM